MGDSFLKREISFRRKPKAEAAEPVTVAPEAEAAPQLVGPTIEGHELSVDHDSREGDSDASTVPGREPVRDRVIARLRPMVTKRDALSPTPDAPCAMRRPYD